MQWLKASRHCGAFFAADDIFSNSENNIEDDEFAEVVHLVTKFESFLKNKCYDIIGIGGKLCRK